MFNYSNRNLRNNERKNHTESMKITVNIQANPDVTIWATMSLLPLPSERVQGCTISLMLAATYIILGEEAVWVCPESLFVSASSSKGRVEDESLSKLSKDIDRISRVRRYRLDGDLERLLK